LDHSYQFSKGNSLVLKHQAYFENKFYEYIQGTSSARLGNSIYASINNKTRFDVFYNKVGVSFKTNKLGEINFFIDNYTYNQFFKVAENDVAYVPNSKYNLHNRINNIGGNMNSINVNGISIFYCKMQFQINLLLILKVLLNIISQK